MANETRLKLYKALGNAGFNIGSYEDFDRRMNNAADREKFHYAVSQAGYNIGDFETFDKRIKDSKYQLTTNGKRVNVSEKDYKDFARRHPGKSPQTQQAKQVGSGVFGSQGNVPSSIARQDNYTRPGSLVEQLDKRDKEVEQAITRPLRETAKKVRDNKFTPQKVQYVDDKGKVVEEDEVYPVIPKETAEDMLNRMGYERMQAANKVDLDGEISRIEKESDAAFKTAGDRYMQKMQENPLAFALSHMSPQSAPAPGQAYDFKREVEQDPEFANKFAALQLLKDADYIQRAAGQSKKTEGVGGWFKDAAYGGKEAFKKASTWDSGDTTARTFGPLLNAANKFDRGEQLTPSEQELLKAAAINAAYNGQYGDDVSSGVKAGQITVEALPFMAEMLANPASGTGKALQKKFVSKGMTELVKGMVKSIAKKQGRKAAAKELAKGTLARVGGDLLGAAVMAGTTGAEGVAGDTFRRMQGQSQYGVDVNGDIQYSGRGEDRETNPLVAAAKAFGARTIENHSEMVGAYFGPVLGVGGEAVAKGLSKMKLGGVVDFIKSIGATKGAKLVDNFFERTKWDGTIGEYAEEVVGGIENALVVGDQTLDTDPETGVFNGEQNLETFLSVALMGGFMSTLHTGAGAWSYAKGKQQLNRAEYLASESLGGKKWDGIKQILDKSTDADASKNLNQILSDNSLSAEQKAAVREYAKRKEALRGVLYGEEARKKEKAQEKAVTRASNIDVADDGQTVVQTNQNGEVIGEEKFEDEEEAKAHVDMLKMQRAEQDFQDDLAMAIEASEQRRQAVENGTPDDFPLSEEMETRVRTMAMNQIIPEGVEEGSPEYEAFIRNMDTPGTAENDILQEMMDKFDPLEDTYETVAVLEDSDREEIDKAIKADPVKRTERQQKLVSEVAWRLHMYNFPKGELHPEQSFTDGQTQADLDGAGTEYAMPENMVHAREDMEEAQTALDDAMAQNSELAGYVNETINANEPMSPEDIVAGMVGRFSDEERRVVCDFINAQSRLQGYLDFTDKKMRQFVARETSKRAFKGTLNGAQQGNMVMVTDGEKTYFLVGGDVSTDENGRLIDGGGKGIVVVDEQGNIVPMGVDASLTIMPGQTYDEYSASLLEQMQVKTTAEMGYEAQPSPSPSEEGNAEAKPQPTDNGAQPAAEAGQEQTGANETAGAAPVAETEQPTQPSPAGKPAGTVAQEIPTDKDGVKMYEQGVNVDDAIADIRNDGMDPSEFADLAISEAETELSKMKEPKTRADLVRNNARRKELQNTIDYYTSMKERVSPTPTRPEGQETAAATEGEPAGEAPEWRYDKPEDARRRGYKVVEGHRIDRQEEKPMPQGMEVEVQYSTKDKVKGRLTVSELDDVQGSHLTNGQRNEKHFLPEAQPKSEFGADRQTAAKTNASEENFRPELMLTFNGTQSAYSGSTSQTNRRGEIIQGNGRRNLAEYIYAPGNEAVARKYKDFLKAHAEELGTTAEAIEQMDKPFAHIVLDVTDAEAIRLGQFTAQDLESGGKKVPEVSTVTTKLGGRYSNLANIILNHEDPDASLSERIEANAETAVKWLNNTGVINNTEAKTLLEDKALARQFLKDVITDQLFKDAHPDLRTMFYELPKNIQSAIISVVGREVAISEDMSILKDIQESIRAYHELTVSSPEFAGATGSDFEKRYVAVTAAVNDWLRQINMDGTVNSEKFSNFALELAKRYKSLKDQKTLAGLLRSYYDMATGATRELGMFDDNSQEPKTKEELIKQIFGIDYGRQRTVPLAGDNQGSEEGREGSTGNPESGEPEPSGTRQADNRRRDTGDGEVGETPSPALPEGSETDAEGEPSGTVAPSMEEIKDATGVEEPKKEGESPSGNKLVTDERYAELKKRMRDKLLGQMNVGVDPEILAIGVEMAVYHIEKGARKFADFARGMIEDLGDVIRPYLKAFYNGARDLPEMDEYASEMDDYQTVQGFDVANFDKAAADQMEQAKEIRDEAKVDKDVQKAKENIKVVAKENKKKKKNVSSQQESAGKTAGTEQQLDLFNLNTEGNDIIRRTDDGRTGGLQTDGNIGEVDNGGNSEEAPQGSERPDGRREEGRDRGLGDGLHDGLRPDDHVEETEAEPQPQEKKNQRNNRNERGKDYAPTSATARVKANIAAIKLLKQLEAEDRDATPEEMAVLKQYSGWGGLGGAFNESSPYYNEVRDLLDDAEYDSAAMSINSAYYTPASVIDRLWDVATKLGFKGGKVLESSAGIGNIIGSIPESMNERSDIEMVEIDSISGRILAKLYPDAKVNIKGFEDTRVENGSVDLAITNVPFVTGLKVRDEVDTDLSRQFGNIHDFVIAKNIRKLKEGGIGIFITTSNTLDKSDSLREWIDGKGDTDVMGVFRLNNETFGGTNVTSDIIVVRKRVNGERHPDAIDVKQSSVIRDGEYENQDGKYDWKTGKYEKKRTSMRVNNYLNEHPEDMGGEMAFGFEKGDTFRPGSYGLYPSEKNQEQLLDAWVRKMKNVFAAVTRQRTQQEDTDVREGRMFVKDGKIFVSQQGKAVPYAAKKAKVKGKSVEECVKDYVAIRESLADVLKYQLENESDADLKPLLDKLNKAYDNFVKKYGYLHKNVAISFLRDDIEFPDIAALENYSESKDIEGNKIVRVGKSKVFEGRVLRFKTEPKPQSVKDGVLASVQQFGKIDLGWIAQNVPGQTEASVRAEILNSGYGFEDPVTKKVEVRYEYLSGNVREKLRQARENNTDGRYNKNIEALEKVMPMDIPAHLIDFSLGSSWIDPKLYEDFVKDKYGCTVRLVNVGGVWSMEVLRGEHDEKNRAGGVHSELLGDTIPASKLVEAAINNRTYKVQRTFKEWDGSKRTETDKAATQACQNRIGEIKDEFNEWAKGRMQTDVEMAEKMMRVYNDKFNSMVPKEVDDTFVPDHFEGAVDYIHLYPHQSKAVMRAVTEPVMLAHQVGAGKTFTLITTAMEMRRLGTAKKPMIVVQNATVGQFVAAAKTLYPNAKILSLTERDRDAEGRRSFYGKIKYNDWDMIVIPQSTFERIPDSPERQEEFIQEKIDDKLHALEAARKAKADDRLVKQMEREIDELEQERDDIALGREPQKGKKGKKKDEEKTKKNTAARAKEQLDRHADDVMYFDDMGIDALLIDEAHEYKRLGFSTTMGRGVKGIDPAGSKKAAGVYLKTRGILKSNGWKNVVFATGTPISNTAAEIWTFMKYLMPKEVMMEQEIWYFDDFVHNFGKVAQSLEFATNGKFKENTRFAAYINKPELIRIWSTVADTVLAKDMPSVAEKLPEKENGKDQDVFLPQTQSLIGIMRAVRKRLEEFEQMSGAEKRANSSIPLVMYGLAKRAAIDPRLVDAGAMDEPNSKTNKAAEEIVKDLAATESYNGTAAVFCDMQNGPEGFNIFQEMKRKLVEKGIPESKIAIITSGMTITQKEKIFEQVNSGDIRVIMGSTQTLGTGVNIQERLHLLIHMDAPDRPMDYTQRNGRILRQGNLHKEWGRPIRILRFGVEDSLDVTSYQRLKTKSGFIDSIMDGKGALANNQVDRTLEEEEEGLFDNPVAVLSGSQYALKKTQAERELRKWQSKRQQWEADQIYIENTLRRNKGQNKEAEERIKEYDKQIELAKKHFPDGKAKTITIKGVETKTEEELQKALTEQVNKPIRERVDNLRNDHSFTKGTVKIPMKFDNVDVNVEVEIERETEYVQGKGMKTTMHTTYRYTIPALGLDEPSMERGFIKDIINDIKEDITAQTAIDRKESAERGIENRKADNEQLEARRSPTFKDEDKLAAAREKVDEYTAKMKEEMAEKEAKYAAMDAEEVDIEAIQDNAEEEEDDSGTRLREVEDYTEEEQQKDDEISPEETDARRKTDGNGGSRLREGSASTEIPEQGSPTRSLSQPGVKMKEHITKVAKKIGAKVVFHDDASTITNTKVKEALQKGKKVAGWYDPKDGSVHFFMPNIKSRYEAEKTIWHEVVGHKGMRALLGEEGYRTFMRRLWMDKSEDFREMHQWVVQNFMRYGGDLYETMDEWFAYNVVEPSVPKTMWDKVMQVLGDVLRKLGFMNTPNMKDMKYMLWLSRNAIREGDAWTELQRNATLAKLDLETRRNARTALDGTRARDGFANTPTGMTEREMYRNGLMRKMFAWTEAHQDYMASAKLLMDAILKWRKVLDKFNFYWLENHSDSKIKKAEDVYVRDYCKPMEEAIKKCIAAIGGKLSDAYEIVEDYMAMKHGLERNREFFVRDWLEEKRKKTPTIEDLDEEAKREFERAARGIEDAFEDGQIETEEERDSELQKALQDTYLAMLDRIESGFAAAKQQPTDNLAEWLKGLDDFIREHIDEEYNPNEHDYSGLTSFNANVNANVKKGYDDDAIVNYVMDMEGKMGKENVDELWKQKGRMTQFALDIEHEAGLITDKNYEKVSQMFHWYMPLRKWDEDMAEDIWSYMNTKKSTYVGNTLMKAKGRKSRAEMPIGTMFAMGGNAIVRAARNEVKQSFAGFVRKYEKPGEDALVTELEAWVENLGTEENPDWVYSFPDIPEGASRDDIIQAKAEWAQHMLDLMQEGRAKRVRQSDSIPYRFENKKRSRPEHIVEVYEDGRPHFFIVNDNPRAAQAINGKLKPETKHKLTAKINRFMSSVFTSYSPTFMARNAFRDAEFASSMLSVKEGWDYCKRFMENYMKVTHFMGKRPLMFTLFRKFRDGTLDESNKMERYFKEFAENGGITGYVMENNAERWEKEILAGVKEIGENKVVGITKNIVKRFMEGVEHAGEAIENAARFATYVTSREEGRTITKSVNDAKEVSVNFNRKGAGYKTESLLNEKGEKTANTVWAAKTAQYMRANTLFYNASLQGIVNSVGNAVRKPWWFAAKFAIPPMVMGALIPVFNAWVHAMLDDDDDKVSKDPYADLPEYTRRMNMCIYIGHGKFVMIPLSIEHRAFFGLGDIMAGQTYDEKLKSVDYPFAVDAVRQMTAFSPVDYNSKETGIEGVTGWGIGIITPAYISPLVNAYFNKSWTGSQIQRENAYGGSNLPEYQKAKDYTNKTLVGASRMWHEMWGGDEAVRAGRNDDNKYKEWIGEISPAKMEYVVEQYFGEPGKLGTGVSDMFSMMFGDKEADLRKIPIVKAFVTLPNDNTQFRRANTKYWRYRDEFKEVEQDDRQYRARIETNPDLKLEYENKFKKTRRYKQWKLYNPGKGGEGFKYKKTIEDLQKRINAEDDPVQKKGLTQEKNAYVQELVELLDGVE